MNIENYQKAQNLIERMSPLRMASFEIQMGKQFISFNTGVQPRIAAPSSELLEKTNKDFLAAYEKEVADQLSKLEEEFKNL